MEKTLLNDFPFTLDVAHIITRLRLEDDEDIAQVTQMCTCFEKQTHPAALCALVRIDEAGDDYVIMEGVRFDSRMVAVNLKNLNRACIYVATCGTQAEELSKTYTDIFQSYAAEIIKETLVGVAGQYVREYISRRYYAEKPLSFMSPGSLKEWPLTQQQPLFELLGGAHDIGVELTPSCLMLPHKSISGMLFASDDNFVNCAFCPIDPCPGRRAEYQSDL